MSTPNVTVVRACLRGGADGSPTAVVLEDDGCGAAAVPGSGSSETVQVGAPPFGGREPWETRLADNFT